MTNDIPISKTKQKRAMHELQTLGEQLAELNAAQLAQIDLSEELREAIADAKRMTKHEARRRQMQYIGRLMRDVDPNYIREKLAIWHGLSVENTALHHKIEQLRDELLDEERGATALQEFAANYPGADLQHLRNVIRNAKNEKLHGKPPKSYRELFKVLREMINEK